MPSARSKTTKPLAGPTTSGANWISTVHDEPAGNETPLQLSATSEKAPLLAGSTRAASTVVLRVVGFDSAAVAVRRPAPTIVGSNTTVPGSTRGDCTIVEPDDPVDPDREVEYEG